MAALSQGSLFSGSLWGEGAGQQSPLCVIPEAALLTSLAFLANRADTWFTASPCNW